MGLPWLSLVFAAATSAQQDPATDPRSYEEWMQKVALHAARYPWDPRAATLLGVAEKATASIFHFDSMRIRKKAAGRVKGVGDLLVVHWDVTLGSVKGELVLHDRPRIASYCLRLPALTVDEMSRLLIPKLLGYPLPLTIDPADPESAAHVPPSVPRQFEIERSVRVTRKSGGPWYVSARYSTFYEGVPDVERIPALVDRVRLWPIETLLRELRETGPMDLSIRNQTLLDEMARRKVPEGIWQTILERSLAVRTPLGAADHPAKRRFNEIVRALERTGGDPASFRQRFEPLIQARLPEQ